MREKFLQQIEDLFDHHIKQCLENTDASESKVGKMTYGMTIDVSESTPHLKTTVSYSVVTKDERQADLDDVSQPSLPGVGKGKDAADVGVESKVTPFNPAFADPPAKKKRGS